MTHTAPMKDSDGEFGEYQHSSSHPCRMCQCTGVKYRIWESSCGGYEDYNYKCPHCGHE